MLLPFCVCLPRSSVRTSSALFVSASDKAQSSAQFAFIQNASTARVTKIRTPKSKSAQLRNKAAQKRRTCATRNQKTQNFTRKLIELNGNKIQFARRKEARNDSNERQTATTTKERRLRCCRRRVGICKLLVVVSREFYAKIKAQNRFVSGLIEF